MARTQTLLLIIDVCRDTIVLDVRARKKTLADMPRKTQVSAKCVHTFDHSIYVGRRLEYVGMLTSTVAYKVHTFQPALLVNSRKAGALSEMPGG